MRLLVRKYQEVAERLVRLVCSQQKMTPEMTEIIVAICWAESQMTPWAIHHNKNGTTDYGICQFNDGKNKEGKPFWIGPGAAFPSSDYVKEHPAECVKVMCELVKKNPKNLNFWATYVSGAYLKYLKVEDDKKL